MSWRQAGTTSNQPFQKWNRLKEVKLDPLEAIGLPSKGDNRLLDFKTQEDYYKKIVHRYRKLQKDNGQDDDLLEDALATLSIHDEVTANGPGMGKWAVPEMRLHATEDASSREITTLIAAMRKLREAIVASTRIDTFALSVYVFIIRATILTGHLESYHPALLHLLRKILPANGSPISRKTEAQVFIGYYILDLACRQGDLGRAYHVRYTYGYEDPNVEGVLKAIVRGDWYSYWRLREKMDRYQKRLCQLGDENMGAHALDCLGATYLSVQKEYVEEVTRQKWTPEELGKMKPNWELEGSVVIIKRIRRR